MKLSIFKIIFNLAYQIKKSVRLEKFDFNQSKYFIDYLRDNRKNQKSHLENQLPWITYQAFNFIKGRVNKNFVVFEYGSGGSTLFFSKSVRAIYSVEHDESWYRYLLGYCENNNDYFSNIDLRLVSPKENLDQSSVVSITERKYDGLSFDHYANVVLDFPDEYFDLIIIDGRVRPQCLINAKQKLKSGGYLLFDNADRSHYQNELDKIKDWKILESYGPTIFDLSFNQTNIYQKPF